MHWLAYLSVGFAWHPILDTRISVCPFAKGTPETGSGQRLNSLIGKVKRKTFFFFIEVKNISKWLDLKKRIFLDFPDIFSHDLVGQESSGRIAYS